MRHRCIWCAHMPTCSMCSPVCVGGGGTLGVEGYISSNLRIQFNSILVHDVLMLTVLVHDVLMVMLLVRTYMMY